MADTSADAPNGNTLTRQSRVARGTGLIPAEGAKTCKRCGAPMSPTATKCPKGHVDAHERRVQEAIRVRGRDGRSFNSRLHPRDREGKFRAILGRIAATTLPGSTGRGGLQGMNAQAGARAILSGVGPSDLPYEQREALMGQLDAYISAKPGDTDAVTLRSRLAGHSPQASAVAADLHAELAKARRVGASGPRHGGYIEALRTAVDHPNLDSLQRMDSTDRPQPSGEGEPPREWKAGHAEGIKRAIEIAKKHEPPETVKTVADKLRDEGHHIPSWWGEQRAHEYAHEVRSDAAKGVAKPHEDLPLRELKPGAEVADPKTGKGYTVVAHEGGTGSRGLTRLKPHDVLAPERTALSHEQWQVVKGETQKPRRERSVATKQRKVGDIVSRPGAVRAGSQLVVYRDDGSKQRIPVEGSMLDAQAHAADIHREDGVYRVGLEDPMRNKETWSTDDAWFDGAPDTGHPGSGESTGPSEADMAAMHPKDIDGELSRLWGERQKAQGYMDGEKKWENHYARQGRVLPERELESRRARIAGHQATIDRLDAAAKPYEDEYRRRGGWQRYFLVTNGNGHVHKGTNCSTCRRTTQYAWLVSLADKPHKDMVSEFGEKACSTCFPDAPSMYAAMKARGLVSTTQRADDSLRAERQAERARRQEAKDAKGITDVDGSPLRVPTIWGTPERINSLVTARRELVDALVDLLARPHATGLYATPEGQARGDAAIAKLVAAIAAKTDEAEEAVRAEAAAKAAKKWKKDYRNPEAP